MVTTYMGDGKPLPSFKGDPMVVSIEQNNIDEIADFFWTRLHEDNKVSLAVKEICPCSGKSKIVLRNKLTKVQ